MKTVKSYIVKIIRWEPQAVQLTVEARSASEAARIVTSLAKATNPGRKFEAHPDNRLTPKVSLLGVKEV